MKAKNSTRNTLKGISFLLPNLTGFALFTMIPLVLSLVMAFSNWNLSLHNLFKSEPIQWVLLRNFEDLLSSSQFWKYLGNTLFFMLGIPFSIAGSLLAAIMLNQDIKAKNKKLRTKLIVIACSVTGLLGLLLFGFKGSALSVFLVTLFGLVFIGGVTTGSTVYRTLFYTPHFTAGVATFILWKKIFNSQTGPLTTFLQPILDTFTPVVNFIGHDGMITIMYMAAVCMLLLLHFGMSKLTRWRQEGEAGYISLLIGFIFLSIPILFILSWLKHPVGSQLLLMGAIGITFYFITRLIGFKSEERIFPDRGIGNAIMLCLVIMIAEFLMLGISSVAYALPEMASDGLTTPNWLTDYEWAKPSLMFMIFWASIGSNQMLLYLAALSNVSPELSEAADIDGANKFQKFWHVTWPQLAPVTFFIAIMAVIHGMQEGFEIAKTMTDGGPAGATTTLEYYIYEEGFAAGRLAYASAISWVMFGIIFCLTLFNWKFGNRYVND